MKLEVREWSQMLTSKPPGGTHIGKRYGDVLRSWPPFFQTSHCSLAYQFTVNAPLLCPLISIFRKFLHFQPCFGQNSSSLDPNFSKFLFLRPLFFKENLLPRPYILKPVWHTSTKQKVECPQVKTMWARIFPWSKPVRTLAGGRVPGLEVPRLLTGKFLLTYQEKRGKEKKKKKKVEQIFFLFLFLLFTFFLFWGGLPKW